MRWYRLTAEEARTCNAPSEVDELGALALSLFGQWRPDELFMILTAYIDESGMAEEEHLTMGGWVFKLGRSWDFAEKWNKLLDKEGIPYAHLVEMKKRSGPFKNWGTPDIARFYKKGFILAQRNAIMGVTASVNKAEFKEHYRGKFPPKHSPDSMYGMCTRAIIEMFTGWLDKHAEIPSPRINLIFDRQKQGGAGAQAVFDEIKDHYDDAKRVLGNFTFGDLKDHCGLQIADYLVAIARRLESTALERGIRFPTDKPLPRKQERGKCRVLHFDLNTEVFDIFHKEKVDLKKRKRWLDAQVANADR